VRGRQPRDFTPRLDIMEGTPRDRQRIFADVAWLWG
jgi:hypothetical protein